MHIPSAIQYLYPGAETMRDFEVRDDSDGKGPYIAYWGLDDPQPTDDELAAAWAEIEAQPAPEPEPTETEQLRADNAVLLLELAHVTARQDEADAANAALLLTLAQGGVI